MTKKRRIAIRVSDDEYEEIRAAADEADRSMSAHLRQSATSSVSTTVPSINKTVWLELAPVVANLNQLARRANRFRRHLEEAPDLKPDTRQALVGLMKSTRRTVREIRDDVHTLRRDLYGIEPIRMAADTLDDWRRVAPLGRTDVDPDRLAEVADALRTLADDLHGEGDDDA